MIQLPFIVVLLITTTPVWWGAFLGRQFGRLVPPSGRERYRSALARCLILMTSVSWRLAFFLCRWIRLDIRGLREFREQLGSTRRPAVLVMNHASNMDTVLSVPLAPLRRAHDFRLLTSSHIYNVPILHDIQEAQGHIPVPFKEALNQANYAVDSEKMNQEIDALEAYMRKGGIVTWFPEGNRNRDDARQLKQFRAGGFVLPARVDCEIWCFALAGTSDCWPVADVIGGKPARLGCTIFRLCGSSHELLADADVPEGAESERAKCLFLANLVQKRIQGEVDLLAAEGFGNARDQ